jgi:hypothetical protein
MKRACESSFRSPRGHPRRARLSRNASPSAVGSVSGQLDNHPLARQRRRGPGLSTRQLTRSIL